MKSKKAELTEKNIGISCFFAPSFIALCRYCALLTNWRFTATQQPEVALVSFPHSTCLLRVSVTLLSFLQHLKNFRCYICYGWSVIGSLWCDYCDSLKAQIVISNFLAIKYFLTKVCMKVKVTQLYQTLCDPMGYTVLGILQAECWSG